MLAQLRQQSLDVWNRQTQVQRVVLIVLVISALILVPLLVNWASTPSYTVAYSGLSETDASQIVGKLDELSIEYKLQGSGTILVPQDQVYAVRLRMAREGLPQAGTTGFEVFSTNTLGMTEFTQQVYYQQALEGELERTIGGLSAVQAVRVAIVTPEKSLIAQEQALTTASITIQEKLGSRLDAAQVSAITHLVASSVEGLKPENVVVVDVDGNMLASGESTGQAAVSAQTNNQRTAEASASSDISRKVQGLLETALGPNRSVVQAAVTMNWTEKEVTTQAFDPASQVVRSSQFVTENYTTTNGMLSGIPGSATNLPPTTNSSGSGNESLTYTRTEKTLNYEITKSESKETLPPGKIDRISLSVLVDGITDTVQLASLQSAIAAAAGIDATRGDVLSVETLNFDRTYYQTQATDMDTTQRYDLYWRIGEVALAVLLLVGMLWYIQRLLNRLRLTSTQTWTPVFKPVSEMALPSSTGMAPGMVPGMAPGYPGMAPAPMPGIGFPGAMPGIGMAPGAPGALPGLAMPPQPEPLPIVLPSPKLDIPAISAEDEQMQKILQRMAEESPASIAEIIQLWLSEDEK